jgi:NitT/TauT family transport system ATP-binding protein
MIEVDAISFSYARGPSLFEDFSLHLERGESMAIIGPSGCGKTTFLYLLAGLVRPTRGEIRIDGKRIEGPRERTALILQEFGLLPWRTVRQNVELGLRIRGVRGDSACALWLRRLGIEEVAESYPQQISGGQRQRTAIARALVLRPDLLLMDEPFSSLDAPTRESLQDLTVELQREEGLTVILVTHTIEEAAFIGRRILLLLRPPHRKPIMIENPKIPESRSDERLLEVCRKLRGLMEVPWSLDV